MRRFLVRLLTFNAFLTAAALAVAAKTTRDVTFISTSDAHYREPDHAGGTHNDLNRASLEEINRIAGTAWPDKLGGDKIAKPRGVLLLGDVIDDGDRGGNGRKISEEQFKLFLADFGLDGTDGLLKYPVFEGWGNHDGPPEGKEKFGFSFRAQLKQRNQVRKEKGLISNVSDNGLHYSWDWDDVHFVQLNKWTCINDGQTENGFFVVQLTGDRLRAAFRFKTGLTRSKPGAAKPSHEWGGQWGWNWLLDKKLSAAGTTKPAATP